MSKERLLRIEKLRVAPSPQRPLTIKWLNKERLMEINALISTPQSQRAGSKKRNSKQQKPMTSRRARRFAHSDHKSMTHHHLQHSMTTRM
jgi:hypothetical protein